MQFSSGLLLGLLILFPGVCFYISLFAEYDKNLQSEQNKPDRTSRISLSGPPPNSITAIFIIGVGTLLSHLLGSGWLLLNKWWIAKEICAFPFGFDTNIYDFQSLKTTLSTSKVFSLLLWVTLLSATMLVIARLILAGIDKKHYFYRWKYGEFSDIHWQSRYASRALIAKVLTQTQYTDTKAMPWQATGAKRVSGYTGMLKELVTSRGKIKSVYLIEALPYTSEIQSGQKKIINTQTSVSHVYLPIENIKNIEFEIIEIDEEMVSKEYLAVEKVESEVLILKIINNNIEKTKASIKTLEEEIADLPKSSKDENSTKILKAKLKLKKDKLSVEHKNMEEQTKTVDTLVKAISVD